MNGNEGSWGVSGTVRLLVSGSSLNRRSAITGVSLGFDLFWV